MGKSHGNKDMWYELVREFFMGRREETTDPGVSPRVGIFFHSCIMRSEVQMHIDKQPKK